MMEGMVQVFWRKTEGMRHCGMKYLVPCSKVESTEQE
jgi:hypothetical protein